MLVIYCSVCKKRPANASRKSVATVSGPRVRVVATFEPYSPSADWHICPHCRAEALAEAAVAIGGEKVVEKASEAAARIGLEGKE